MQEANITKIVNMMGRPFHALPIATDLPRLGAVITVCRQGKPIYSPSQRADSTSSLCALLSVLSAELEPEKGRDVVSSFRRFFYEKPQGAQIPPSSFSFISSSPFSLPFLFPLLSL
jgi:hypothetical protein